MRRSDLLFQIVNHLRARRRVRPLGLFFRGKVWTLVAWCELRRDFRGLRLDRIEECTVLEAVLTHDPDKSLQRFLETASRRTE